MRSFGRAALLVLLLLLFASACDNKTGADNGLDGDRAEDESEGESELAPIVCPPPPPYGVTAGTTLTDLTFQDCAGNPIHLFDLCGANAGMVYFFYAWCASCFDFVRELPTLNQTYQARGLKTILIIAQDSLSRPATLDYCQKLKEAFGLEVAVVIDPNEQFASYGSAGTLLLTNERGRIVFLRDNASLAVIQAAIEQELSR